MSSFTRVLLSSLFVVCAQPALAGETGRDAFFDRTIPLPTFAHDSSDADLLAERHLALYRASQLPPKRSALENTSAQGNGERDVAPIPVRTSATAAPRPRAPANPSAEN